MSTVDMTHRKLNFPPRFLPYLEKHRIFELFHECIELLVQNRPRDHVEFLKNILPCASVKRDNQRIVFLAPPGFDREYFTNILSENLGIQPVTKEFVIELTKANMEKEAIIIAKSEETLEEESCICPGEGDDYQLRRFSFPLYYPEQEEYIPFEAEPESEPEPVVEKETICVCPCVEKELENSKNEEDAQKRSGKIPSGLDISEIDSTNTDDFVGKYEEEEEEEEQLKGEMENKSSELICVPRQRAQLLNEPEVEAEESTVIEPDYGLLANCEISAKGWILEDFPLTGEDAEKLCKLGVIPTHAIRIIIDEKKEAEDKEYKLIVKNWTKVYKFVPVLEIKLGNRSMTQFAEDMRKLLSGMPHRHPPMLPRIVLIGSRGSGVTTQAQKLSAKYGFVHVEYDIVIAKILQQDEDEIIKLYKRQLATRVEPEVEAVILERALLTTGCRNRGWILTGYPRNIDQMRMLDVIATPPNRIIFLEVPARECFVRLFYRKFDPCLGEEYKIPKIQPFGLDSYTTHGIEPEVAARLVTHPKNNKKQIIHDIENYFIEKKDMMLYCGKTASYVNGNKTVDVVFELIEKIIIDPAPPQPPRDPLVINYGIDESYRRLKKFRLIPGMFLNNMVLNPPENKTFA